MKFIFTISQLTNFNEVFEEIEGNNILFRLAYEKFVEYNTTNYPEAETLSKLKFSRMLPSSFANVTAQSKTYDNIEYAFYVNLRVRNADIKTLVFPDDLFVSFFF